MNAGETKRRKRSAEIQDEYSHCGEQLEFVNSYFTFKQVTSHRCEPSFDIEPLDYYRALVKCDPLNAARQLADNCQHRSLSVSMKEFGYLDMCDCAG